MTGIKLYYDAEALQSLHRFGDELEEALLSITSDDVNFEPDRNAPDSIGRHWYGMRCKMQCKKTGLNFYLHIGLVYHPDTKTGLMVEVDKKNNLSAYEKICRCVKKQPEFEINREEPAYFKLFMPELDFVIMNEKERKEQIKMLSAFVQSAGESIAAAAYQKGFRICPDSLHHARNFAHAIHDAIKEMKSEICRIEINENDKDNFGQYAQGYRYYLKDREEKICFYAYFGAIFSYKKQPAGIFVEIDWLSNQQGYDKVFRDIEEYEGFDISKKEPEYLKLFMKEKDIIDFNEDDYELQIKRLILFIKDVNEQILKAYYKENKETE